MKLAIATRSDDNIAEMASITHPVIKEYAHRVGADFVVLDENVEGMGDVLGRVHYRIFALQRLFDHYDRILSLDTDILIRQDCPDIFGLVNEWDLGSVFEDKGTRQDDRRERMRKVQAQWGYVAWTTGYINTGVFVSSVVHSPLFQPYQDEYWMSHGYDDVHLGWMIHHFNYGVQELPFVYNHMSMFSEPWNGNAPRHKSFIIHYAGGGKFPGEPWGKGKAAVLDIMRRDKERWYG